MSLQPALDHITAEAWRRGLNLFDAEPSWWEAEDGEGVWYAFTFPDGTEIKGYAPEGMKDIRAGADAAT